MSCERLYKREPPCPRKRAHRKRERSMRERPSASVSAIPLFRLPRRTEPAPSPTVVRIHHDRTARGIDGATRQQQGDGSQTTERFHYRTQSVKTLRVYGRTRKQSRAFRNALLAVTDTCQIVEDSMKAALEALVGSSPAKHPAITRAATAIGPTRPAKDGGGEEPNSDGSRITCVSGINLHNLGTS